MGYKILLADDSVTVQKIITLTFSDEGVDVVTVNNGDEAISRLQYLRPALVMADVSIPGRNGYEICEFVKMHPEMKETPVILLVPAFEPFDEERARRIGADYHLTKPFQSIRTLISTVKDLAERKSDADLSVVGSGLTAIRGADQGGFETAEIDPKRAKIEELIRLSSEEPSGNDLEEEVLLEVDLANGKNRYSDSLAVAPPSEVAESPEEVELVSAQSGEGMEEPFAKAARMTGAIEPSSIFSTGVSSSNSPNFDPSDSDPVLDLDDVLELEDVLPGARHAAAAAAADETTNGIEPPPADADHVGPQAERHAGAVLTQDVIDEIVNRLSARLSEELLGKLSGEIARRVAAEVAESVKRQFSTQSVAFHNSENLLDIE